MRVYPWLVLVLAAPAPILAQGGVTLPKLIEIAKGRATRIRAELEAKFEPFLDDLSKPGAEHSLVIDSKIDEVVKLGDALVPLLLEKLEPRNESPKFRNLAANCARILGHLEPDSFVEPLLEIAEGDNYTGIGLAIALLGETNNARAGELLTRMLNGLDPGHRVEAIRSLTRLGYKGAALEIARGLPSPRRDETDAALAYLGTIGSSNIVPEIRRAVAELKQPQWTMPYLQLIARCANKDAESAHLMLSFLDDNRLDRPGRAELIRLLAAVAPEGDEKTIERLQALIDGDGAGDVELAAAVTLRTLGDRDGPNTLLRNLRRRLSTQKGRQNYLSHLYLGDYYMEFDEPMKAARAYVDALEQVKTSSTQRGMLSLLIARAHARRKQPMLTEIEKYLQATDYSREKLLEEGRKHAELAEIYQNPRIKKFLDSLPQ